MADRSGAGQLLRRAGHVPGQIRRRFRRGTKPDLGARSSAGAVTNSSTKDGPPEVNADTTSRTGTGSTGTARTGTGTARTGTGSTGTARTGTARTGQRRGRLRPGIPRRRRRARRSGSTRPVTRMERRQAAKVRRARATVVGAVAVSGLILVLWFPAGSLLHQRAAINAAASELTHLQQQDRQLAQEQKALGSPAEIQRVARQQYQLVSPGERAFLVLPPAGSKTSATQYEGDPANQPLVSPSAATELPPRGSTASSGSSGASSSGANSSGTNSSGGSSSGAQGTGTAHGSGGFGSSTHAGGSPGFLGRVAQTLEFWR